MKRLLLLFLIISSSLLSSAQFEGIVTMIPDFKNKPESKDKMVFYIKGDKVAMEPNGTSPVNGRMVGNRKTKEYYMLVEAEGKKIAINLDMDQLMRMAPGVTSPEAPQDAQPVRPAIKETGARKVIDGYSSRQILTEMNGNKTEMWITKDVDLSLADLFFSPNTGSQYKNYEGIEGMVLEAWNYDANGKISSSVKATPEKKAIDDKMFVIPEDYVKMDMMQLMQAAQGNPEMMQQMMEMFGTEK